MRSHRILSGTFLSISSLLVAGGCSQFSLFPSAKWQPPASFTKDPAKSSPALASTGATTLPSSTDPDAPPPDMLAAKVQSYRKDVEPQIPAHPRASASAPSTRPALWETADFASLPGSVQFSPYQQEETPLQSASSAQSARPDRASSTGDANFPITVPEGQEQSTAIPASSTQSPDGLVAANDAQPISKRVRDYPHDLEGQLDYQLMLFAGGHPTPELGSLSALSAEDREILSTLMDGLTNFRSILRSGDNLLLGTKIKPLADMTDRLRSQSELAIPTLALCREVKSFGVYTPVDSNRFTAGKDNNVIIYAEVENFQSQTTVDNQYQTKLTEELVLYTESGMAAWPAKSTPQPVVDVCRVRRHDFFIARMVALPKNLSIGRYLMKVTVTDETANHVAEATAPVEIVAE